MAAGSVGLVRDADVLRVMHMMPMGSFVRAYTIWAGKKTNAPLIFHPVCALAVIAPLLSPDTYVDYYGRSYAIWWGLMIGEHGSTFKSTCLGFAEDLLVDIDELLVSEDAGSWEGQLESLRVQPTQLITHSDFGTFLAQTKQSYMRPLREFYLRLWDCRPVGRRLAKAGEGPVKKPRASVLGGVTPEQVEQHTDEDVWSSGYMSRWFLALGVAERPSWKAPAKPIDSDAARLQLLEMLKRIKAAPDTKFAGIRPDVMKKHVDWQMWLAKEMKAGHPLLRGTYSRAATLTLRLAMLLEADYGELGRKSSWFINMNTWEPAYQMVRWHIKSAAWLIESVCTNCYQRNRRAFLAALYPDGRPTPPSKLAATLRLEPRALQAVITGLQAERTIELAHENVGDEGGYRLMAGGHKNDIGDDAV